MLMQRLFGSKALKKSGETLEKFVSYRPFHMFITVDMNMCIDRSTCS